MDVHFVTMLEDTHSSTWASPDLLDRQEVQSRQMCPSGERIQMKYI